MSYSPQPMPQQPHPQESSATAGALPLTIWGATDVGREREGNEDAIFPQSDGGGFEYRLKDETLKTKGQLLIVADGVGGAQAGRASSRWTIERAVERYYELPPGNPAAALQEAVTYANASLYQYLEQTNVRDAGCTITAAVIHENQLYVANVGDSRAYLIRNNEIHLLTRDHTLTQQKLDQGVITAEQAATDPDKSVLTRSMGAAPTVQVDVFQAVPLQSGDLVLLCSDGLYDMLTDQAIAGLALSAPPQKAVPKLIERANKNGGFDNISVILVQAGARPGGAGIGEMLAGFSPKQRGVLTGMAIAVAILVIGLGGLLGWAAFNGDSPDSEGTPVAPVTTPAPAETNSNVASPETTPERQVDATSTTLPGQSTSTPRPTSTPTPTNMPPPPTTRRQTPPQPTTPPPTTRPVQTMTPGPVTSPPVTPEPPTPEPTTPEPPTPEPTTPPPEN